MLGLNICAAMPGILRSYNRDQLLLLKKPSLVIIYGHKLDRIEKVFLKDLCSRTKEMAPWVRVLVEQA